MFVYLLWSYDNVYHKQEVRFLLYLLAYDQIATWQYNTNLFDGNLTITVDITWSWLTVGEVSFEFNF